MKIVDLKTFVVGNQPPGFGGRYFLFVKLVTDGGIEGVGEVYADTFGAHTMARMVADVFERHVLGMDPFHIEALWRKVYGTGYTLRPDVSLMGVLSGLEIALWDIVGRAQASRSTSCSAARCMSVCAATPTSTRRATRPRPSITTPSSRRSVLPRM